MSKQEKENKKNALFGTIIFHAILVFLLTLPFMSLTYQDPPLPSGNGISINFSSNNSGFTSQSSNQTLQVVENEVVENEVVKNEVVENEVAENEVVENEVVKNEVVEIEVVKNEVVEIEVVEIDSSLNEILDIARGKQNDSPKSQNRRPNNRRRWRGKSRRDPQGGDSKPNQTASDSQETTTQSGSELLV